MVIRWVRRLDGPNVYTYRPVLLMELDLEELAGRETREFNGFNERLLALLPGLNQHGCGRGTPGAFVERLEGGTYFGHVIEHIALELSEPAGAPVTFGKTVGTNDPRVYHLIVEFVAAPLMRFLLETAIEIVANLVRDGAYEGLDGRLEQARRLAADTMLGPSTRAIVAAARRRGIPVHRLNDDSLVQLGYGKCRRLVQATVAATTSAISVEIAANKQLTRELLDRAFIPVPAGEIALTEADAMALLSGIGGAVAVKPVDGNQGRAVSLNVRTPDQMRQAFAAAAAEARSGGVVVEEMLDGSDYRVLVVGGRVTAGSERVPAQIVGDGTHTIAELVAHANVDPRRGAGHEKALTRIRLDPTAHEMLAVQGLSADGVPTAGRVVRLRGTANLSTGGTARDVTDRIHPDVAAICERAARIVGLDICGIDLITRDVSRPLVTGEGIVEVNAGPGIRMHHHPNEGEPRDAGAAIVDMLFPPRETGRIPIAAITGTNGKTTVARMLARAVTVAGRTVGLTTTDGVYIGGRQMASGDMTGPRSARAVLADPAVEVAVLETARGGIVRTGLGYDWSDVAVITNIQSDHIGQDGIESIDDLVHIKKLVAERVREGGTIVLNADDVRVAALAEDERIGRIPREVVFFSLLPRRGRVERHIASGGTAYFPKNGWIVEARGHLLEPICRIASIPVVLGGAAQFNLANAIAATAAARAMGLPVRTIADALETFVAEQENPGRANMYTVNSGYVLLDYGHNPAAIEAVGRTMSQWPGRRLTGILGLPGDRADSVVLEAASTAASIFDRLFIREDQDLRGRQPGEMAELILGAIRTSRPDCAYEVQLSERDALVRAVRSMEPSEIVVLFYEHFDQAQATLTSLGARPAAGGLMALTRAVSPPAAFPPGSLAADRRRGPRIASRMDGSA